MDSLARTRSFRLRAALPHRRRAIRAGQPAIHRLSARSSPKVEAGARQIHRIESWGAIMFLTHRVKELKYPLLPRAYVELLRVDIQLASRGFAAVHARVKNRERNGNPKTSRTAEDVCRAVDVACVLYFKEVLCLQRSAATTCLLREYGIPAEMVIGVQQWPFRAHAWVEVEGRIANDKPYIAEIYGVMDRC